MRQLIIDRPDLQSRRQRYGYSVLTLVLWGLYLYLWLPLITLGAWGMQARFAYVHMVTLGGYRGLLQIVGIYLYVIFAIGVLLVAWSRSNLLRFRGEDRRKAPLPVTSPEIAASFAVPRSVLMSWYVSKSLVIHHNDAGEIIPSAEIIERMHRVATLVSSPPPQVSSSKAKKVVEQGKKGQETRWGGLSWPPQE